MKIAIAGGGIAGLSMALFLIRSGHEPIVIERTACVRREGYMIDFFGSGYDVCERAGLIAGIERLHRPIDRMLWVDAEGRERFGVGYAALRESVFRNRHFNFLRGDLEGFLLEQVERFVDFRWSTTITGFEQIGEKMELRLSDGSELECDLLVGADGVHSSVRKALFGEDSRHVIDLGLHTAAFVLPESAKLEVTGRSFQSLSVPNKMVSIYPVDGRRFASFFVHRSSDGPARTRQDKMAKPAESTASFGWCLPAMLEALDDVPEIYLDSVSQIDLPNWSRGRVVLLGDACQCVSLVAGQGASLAVAGAYVLAQALDESPSDLEHAFAGYAHRLQPGVRKKQAAGRSTAGWFVPESRARIAVRDLAARASTTSLGAWVMRRQIDADSLVPPDGA